MLSSLWETDDNVEQYASHWQLQVLHGYDREQPLFLKRIYKTVDKKSLDPIHGVPLSADAKVRKLAHIMRMIAFVSKRNRHAVKEAEEFKRLTSCHVSKTGGGPAPHHFGS